MIRVIVVDANDLLIGVYESAVVPHVGDTLDANDGHWVVRAVQHDIRGNLCNRQSDADKPKPVCDGVVVYAARCVSEVGR